MNVDIGDIQVCDDPSGEAVSLPLQWSHRTLIHKRNRNGYPCTVNAKDDPEQMSFLNSFKSSHLVSHCLLTSQSPRSPGLFLPFYIKILYTLPILLMYYLQLWPWNHSQLVTRGYHYSAPPVSDTSWIRYGKPS